MDIVNRHIVYCHIGIVYRRVDVVTCSSSHSATFRVTVNKSKPALYKVLIHCNSSQKQLYLSNEMSASVIKVGVVYMSIHVLRHWKEELAWAIDKWFQVISNKMLFKTVMWLRN